MPKVMMLSGVRAGGYSAPPGRTAAIPSLKPHGVSGIGGYGLRLEMLRGLGRTGVRGLSGIGAVGRVGVGPPPISLQRIADKAWMRSILQEQSTVGDPTAAIYQRSLVNLESLSQRGSTGLSGFTGLSGAAADRTTATAAAVAIRSACKLVCLAPMTFQQRRICNAACDTAYDTAMIGILAATSEADDPAAPPVPDTTRAEQLDLIMALMARQTSTPAPAPIREQQQTSEQILGMPKNTAYAVGIGFAVLVGVLLLRK